jgi:hypothetical protein
MIDADRSRHVFKRRDTSSATLSERCDWDGTGQLAEYNCRANSSLCVGVDVKEVVIDSTIE